MPIGFCCTKCYLYNKELTCLKTNSKPSEKQEANIMEKGELRAISTEIEEGLLKVVIGQNDKRIPIIIDLQKQLDLK
jgi:hypothetical protein